MDYLSQAEYLFRENEPKELRNVHGTKAKWTRNTRQ